MNRNRLVGELQYSGQTQEIDGWCWSPDAPDERRIVDVLVNDTVIASIVAGYIDARLVNSGIGDGRHAFRLLLPEELVGFDSLSARDRRSGRVFARIEAGGGGSFDPFMARVLELSDVARDMMTELDAVTVPPGTAGPRASLRAFGRTLRAHARHPHASDIERAAADARARLADRLAPVTLPANRAPAVSVIARTSSATHAADLVRGLAPIMDAIDAELVMVDDGGDPLARLLPTLVRNLRYVLDPTATTVTEAGNIAGDMARGRYLVVLDDIGAPPSAAALETLCDHLRTSDAACFSAWCHGLLARFGIPSPPPPPQGGPAGAALPAPLGARLALPRAAWRDLGTFDPDVAGLDGLETADLLLKADLLGLPCHILTEPPRSAGANVMTRDPPLVETARIASALITFRHRWDRRAVAA